MPAALKWAAKNLSLVGLAFLLAVVVWVSAVNTNDPNEQNMYRTAEIELIGQDPDLLLVNEVPAQARLTLQAPRSIWEKISANPSLVKTWIDLSGLGPGRHTLPLQIQVGTSPVRILRVDPEQVDITLELLVERKLPVSINLTGDLPLGYRLGTQDVSPAEVMVSGPESVVDRVEQVRVSLDVSGAIDTIRRQVTLEAVDELGRTVPNVTLNPREAAIHVPVSLLGGFKNAAVKVVTRGQVAPGYRISTILVSPPTVTLFSDNPQLLETVLGYVETTPVDLNNLVDDIEVNVDLDLPEGITVVQAPRIVVQVGVAAQEGSITLSVPVRVVGLDAKLSALVQPQTVEITVTGPLNLLDKLTLTSFQVVVDVADFTEGQYQRRVRVDQAPDDVIVQTTLPEIVQVTIFVAPPTATGQPVIATPTAP